MTEIETLKAKLKARENRSGFAANVAELKTRIAHVEGLSFTYRDIETGQFVTAEYALANPETTRRVEEA